MTTKGFVKFVSALLFSFAIVQAHAQFLKVDIGVNGLTCSQCSRSVEMQLRKLGFVNSVKMDLEHTNGTIFFKDKAKVDMEAIAQSVIDAGFSLRYLKTEINRGDIMVSSGENCFKLGNNAYVLLKPLKADHPTAVLQFIGKNYLPRKEMKAYQLPPKKHCIGNKTYYVVPL